MRNEVVKVRLFQLFILRICRPQVVEFGVNQSDGWMSHKDPSCVAWKAHWWGHFLWTATGPSMPSVHKAWRMGGWVNPLLTNSHWPQDGFLSLGDKTDHISYDSPKGSPRTFSLRTRILTIWGHLLPTLTVKMQKDWVGMYMVTLPPPAIHTPQGLHSVQQILQNRPRTRLLSPAPGPRRHRLSPESQQQPPASVSWMFASPQNP